MTPVESQGGGATPGTANPGADDPAIAEFLGYADALRNPHLDAWKAAGKPVVGYYCSALPEEVLHAAGVLPYRVRGTSNADFLQADAVLSRFNCTYVRSTLNLAMTGAYDFLDGLVVGNTCDHVRRMYDLWGHAIDYEPRFFVALPHTITPAGRGWLLDEIDALRARLEDTYGTAVTDARLRASFETYAENAALLARVQEFREADGPRLTGTDFLRVAVASASARKEHANERLQQYVGALERRPPLPAPRARLLVSGSYVDTPGFVRVLEHAGALVVADNLCSSARAIDYQEAGAKAARAGDLDAALLARYTENLCPRVMNQYPARRDHLLALVERARVDGVVLQRIEFCDLHGTENMILQHELHDRDVPTLNLDREYFLGDTGRLRTRVEAFLEKIGRRA